MNDARTLTPQQRYDALIAGCWPAYVARWTQTMHNAIRDAVLYGHKLTEPQLTALFVALNPEDGKAMLSLIERRLELEPGKRMTEKPTVATTRVSGSRKMIDAAAIALDAESTKIPPVLMEFKLDGWINGAWGYCETHGKYSNQIICYPAGCFWTVNAGEHYMVWIGLAKHVNHAEPGFGTKAINRRDVELQTLGPETDHFADLQKKARWDAFITLEDLGQAAMEGTIASQTFGTIVKQTAAHFS